MPRYNKDDLKKYYEGLNISSSIQKRVSEIVELYKKLMSEDPEYLMLESVPSPDGGVNYSNVAFLKKDLYVDIPIPEINTNVGFVRITNINAIGFTKIESFNFIRATEKSVLNVTIKTKENVFAFHAVGLNCSELLVVLKEYLLPNLKEK
jgi:hypothetical protein